MNRKGCLLIVLLLAGALLDGCSRSNDDTLATVVGRTISQKEFIKRYKYFLESSGARDIIAIRRSILDNMINEILIRKTVDDEGWRTMPDVAKRLEEIRLQALLDGYSKLLLDTIRVSENEAKDEFRRFNRQTSARFLIANTPEGAKALRAQLLAGKTFKELARRVFQDPVLAENGGFVGYFTGDDMEPAFEESAASLPVGAISDPVKLRHGYAIIKVEDRKEVILASEYDYAKKKPAMESAVRERKMRKVLARLGDAIVAADPPSYDRDVLTYLWDHWSDFKGTAAASAENRENSNREKMMKDVLVRFKDHVWTLADCVAKLEFTTEKQRAKVNSPLMLQQMLEGLIIRDELLRRAMNSGLENNEEVKKQIANIEDQFFMKRWAISIEDTLGSGNWDEPLVKKYFDENKNEFMVPPEVNIAEILVRTKSEAEQLLKNVRKGADFASLARKHSLRASAAARGGELGLGPADRFGRYRSEILKTAVHGVIGPYPVEDFYAIFRILGRHDAKPMAYEEARSLAALRVRSMRVAEEREAALAQLRSRYSFSVNETRLLNVTIAGTE